MVNIKKVSKFIRDINASNHKRLSFPYKLLFALTDKCNSRCLTCNIWKKNSENEFQTDEIERFFYYSNKFSWIDLTGGEIFLRKDIIEVFKIIQRYCKNLLLLHFPTNGLLPDRILDTVTKISLYDSIKAVITVSLDGPKDLHDKIRGVKGGWDKAIETFKELHKISWLNVYLGITLSKYNFNKLFQTYEEVKEKLNWLNLKDIHINIVHYSSHFYENVDSDLSPATQGLLKEIYRFINLRPIPITPFQYIEYKYLTTIEKYLNTRKTPLPCKALNASCFVNPNGDVFPCSIYNRKLGNLREFNYNLEKIWDLPICDEIRKEIFLHKCPDCWTPCEAYPAILGSIKNVLFSPIKSINI